MYVTDLTYFNVVFPVLNNSTIPVTFGDRVTYQGINYPTSKVEPSNTPSQNFIKIAYVVS